jgi:hypothetical protein
MTWLARAWVVVVALATAAALAQAQARPDLSGKWEISQAKSSAGATSNSANISFPSELIITQRPAELHVEVRFPRSEPLTTVYKLDGSEITAGTPAGVTEKATAAWDGNTLVITARRVVSSAFGDFVTDSKEIWTRTGNVLTITKSETSDGVVTNERAVFDRDQP